MYGKRNKVPMAMEAEERRGGLEEGDLVYRAAD